MKDIQQAVKLLRKSVNMSWIETTTLAKWRYRRALVKNIFILDKKAVYISLILNKKNIYIENIYKKNQIKTENHINVQNTMCVIRILLVQQKIVSVKF